MKLRIKFGLTVGEALRLLRESKRVKVFVGYDRDRHILNISKAAVARDLNMMPANDPLFCELNIEDRSLFFGSFCAKHHADKVKKAGIAVNY